MGNELRCRATAGKQSGEGKALLETAELVFRGDAKDFRLKIPFAALKKQAAAKDGKLELATADGVVVLELGAHAEKWADKINHPKSRLDKLGVKPGQRVSVVGVADAALRGELDGRGAVVTWGKLVKDSDVIFFGAARTAELGELRSVKGALTPAGALWIIRPKGGKDITEAQVMAAGKAAGLVDVKVVAFSATHTAEKYVIPIALR